MTQREILQQAILGLEAQQRSNANNLEELRQELANLESAAHAASDRARNKAPRKGVSSTSHPTTSIRAIPEKKTKPKRKLTAAGRARIVAATKKRWAAYHKAAAAAD